MHIGNIVFVQCWDTVCASVIEHALAIKGSERISDHEDGVWRFAIHGFEYSIKIVGLAQAERLNRDPERPRGIGGGVVTHAHAEVVPVPQHRDPSHRRDRLLDQREAFGGESRRVIGNAGDVAARMRQAVNKVRRNRIADSKVDHCRHIRDLASERGWKTAGDDHINLVGLHAADDFAKLTDLTARSTRLERKIFAECVAVLLKLLQQDRPKWRLLVKRWTREERADTVDLGWGLCDRKAGAGNHRADEQGNEVATEHGTLSENAHRLTRKFYRFFGGGLKPLRLSANQLCVTASLVANVRLGLRVQPVTATLLAGALRCGAGAIPPLRAKILDTAFVSSSARATSATHWPLFQRSQSSAFCFGVNHVRAYPSICTSFQRTRLEGKGVASIS